MFGRRTAAEKRLRNSIWIVTKSKRIDKRLKRYIIDPMRREEKIGTAVNRS